MGERRRHPISIPTAWKEFGVKERYWTRASLPFDEWLDALELTFDQAREKAQFDLWFLITEVLGFDRYFAPLHRQLCRQIERSPAISLWLLPRDHLKTTTLTVSRTIQHLISDPNCRILLTTHLYKITLTVSDQIRTLLTKCERLTTLFPEVALPTDGARKGRRDEFNVPGRSNWARKETNISTAAVDASMVSRHFDVMMVDDLQTDRNSKTSEALQAVKDHWNSLWPMLDPDGGKMYICGTRWDQDDLYSHILERCQEIGAFLCIRRALEKDPKAGDYIPIYPRTDAGKKVFTKAILKQRRKVMGDYQFSCQFLNDPIPDSSVRVLHPRQVVYTSKLPENIHHFIFIDPAISTRETADRCAIVVVAVDCFRTIYVVDVIAGKMMPAETARWIYELSNHYAPKEIFCESNAWQSMYKSYIERLIADYGKTCYISEAQRKAGDTAIARILGLQTHFEQGKIQFLLGGRGVEEAIKELLHWSKRRAKQGRDDICSALSDAPQLCWYPHPTQKEDHWTIDQHWSELRSLDDQVNGIGGHVWPNVRLGR